MLPQGVLPSGARNQYPSLSQKMGVASSLSAWARTRPSSSFPSKFRTVTPSVLLSRSMTGQAKRRVGRWGTSTRPCSTLRSRLEM